KHFNPFWKTDTLDGQFESCGQIVDINSTISGEQWCLRQNPEVPTAPAFLQRSFDAVVLELPLQLEQVLEGIFIVRVNRHPLAALISGINGIQSDGLLPFEMPCDNFV